MAAGRAGKTMPYRCADVGIDREENTTIDFFHLPRFNAQIENVRGW